MGCQGLLLKWSAGAGQRGGRLDRILYRRTLAVVTVSTGVTAVPIIAVVPVPVIPVTVPSQISIIPR